MDFARNLEIQGNFVRFQIKVAGVWIWQLTHYRAPLDEVEAAFRLMKFGTREFLNKHCFRIGKEYLVRVGCMKGEFDEHRDHRGERKKDECADTLVAKALGCKADAALKYTKANDCDGKEQKNGLASTLWMLQRMFPKRQLEVVNWGLTALKANCYIINHIIDIASGRRWDLKRSGELERSSLSPPHGYSIEDLRCLNAVSG